MAAGDDRIQGVSGVKGRSLPHPSVDKQLPSPEKGVHPSYTHALIELAGQAE